MSYRESNLLAGLIYQSTNMLPLNDMLVKVAGIHSNMASVVGRFKNYLHCSMVDMTLTNNYNIDMEL